MSEQETGPQSGGNGPAPPLLRIEGVTKTFGGVTALSDVGFAVTEGRVQGLIGPNGAGKTTLFNVITGAYPPNSGTVHLNGTPMQGKPLRQVVRSGVARTFQNVELFESLTALENVMVGGHARTKSGFWGAVLRPPATRREERDLRERGHELLEFVGLPDAADRPAGDLPFGWQRLLEIARALASDPKLLLLDEPAAGLNAVETGRLGELLGRIRDRGVTLMLVEHDMSLTMRVCDRIAVLDQGRLLAEGTPREVQADPAVTAAYLGGGE